MAASIYFWFILNNYGANYPKHQSIFSALLEVEDLDTLTVVVIMTVSTIVLTLFVGFLSRLLFSFKDEK